MQSVIHSPLETDPLSPTHLKVRYNFVGARHDGQFSAPKSQLTVTLNDIAKALTSKSDT